MTSDAKILVRKAELACRDSWGDDFWTDDSDQEASVPIPPRIEYETPESPVVAKSLAASTSVNPGVLSNEDDSFNDAAHLDQEARSAAMRRSPSDALRLAWDRKGGLRQDTPSQPASDDESHTTPDDSASGKLAPAGSRSGTAHQVTAPVPASEVSGQYPLASDAKYHSVPEIRQDIELPLLRNRFHLGRSITPEETSASGMSSYDRALQNAREFKAKQQGTPPPADDIAITPQAPAPVSPPVVVAPVIDDEPEDEVVSVRTNTGVSISRFERTPVISYDDPLDEPLEDDIELERAFRTEPSPQQIGQRWWEAVRQKVLGTGLRSASPRDREEYEDPLDEDEWQSESAAFAEPDEEAFDAPHTWEDTAPDPEPFEDDFDDPDNDSDAISADHRNFDVVPETDYRESDPDPISQVGHTAAEHRLKSEPATTNVYPGDIWGSTHEYLDADQDPASPLEPMTWWPEPLDPPPTPIAPAPATNAFDWDGTTPPTLAADFRERLFGEVSESHSTTGQRQTVQPPRSAQTARPEASASDHHQPVVHPQEVIALPENDPVSKEPLVRQEIDIAPDILRMCETCRSFRPAEDGSRGWCVNHWAFGHRRLVNAGDLACQSSMGCWWLPNDEDVDIDGLLIRLTQQTPRTDRLTATQDRESRRSG